MTEIGKKVAHIYLVTTLDNSPRFLYNDINYFYISEAP